MRLATAQEKSLLSAVVSSDSPPQKSFVFAELPDKVLGLACQGGSVALGRVRDRSGVFASGQVRRQLMYSMRTDCEKLNICAHHLSYVSGHA